MVHVTGSRIFCAIASAVVALGLASAASAAVLDLQHFDRTQIGAARSALAGFQNGTDPLVGPGQRMTGVRTETFAGHSAWNGSSGDANPFTAVGSFSSLGGKGSGGSSINGGTALQIRDNDPWGWGRYDTSGGDRNWLDSNDTKGMVWNASGDGKFNALAFLLTDVADVGAVFSIRVGDTLYKDVLGKTGRLANGSVHLVRILLPEAVDGVSIRMHNSTLNDGFGIDGATVGKIAPVPVPPAALLLVTGAAALVGLRRRRRAV